MNKNNLLTLLFLFLVVCILALLVYTITRVSSEGGQCSTDPLGFVEEKYNVSCLCGTFKAGLPDNFVFDLNQDMFRNQSG